MVEGRADLVVRPMRELDVEVAEQISDLLWHGLPGGGREF